MDFEDVIDSRDGGPEGFTEGGGLGGILRIFPHRHQGHVLGIQGGRSGNG